ncbi:hypothetical protein QE152_g5896 [Popillia japonica]|uniref:Uncharacterized protein n=1 Tax=Popillia japonica TaxID=7064 RepID=A0AAW1MK59_POPJA
MPMKKKPIRKRRIYSTRSSPEICNTLCDDYKEAQKSLRNSIKTAKRLCWKTLCANIDRDIWGDGYKIVMKSVLGQTLCANIDRDIWGDGYKIVMKSVLGHPPKPQLSTETVAKIVDYLFPTHRNSGPKYMVLNFELSLWKSFEWQPKI